MRAEGKEKDMQIARLLAETGDNLMLKQQKVELKQNCHDLLSVVETQQEMIQSLRDATKLSHPDFKPIATKGNERETEQHHDSRWGICCETNRGTQ